MRKVFLSTVPMQIVNQFIYASDEYKTSSLTAFPITILLENNCQEGDEVTLLTIVTESEGGNIASENYIKFCEHVRAIAKAKRVNVELVKIPMSARSNSESHRKLYKALLNELKSGDEIHADITYGFKSTPIVIFAALNQSYQLNDNVDVAEIMYGNLYNGSSEKTPELFDVTSLFYLNSLSGVLGNMNNSSDSKNDVMNLLLK